MEGGSIIGTRNIQSHLSLQWKQKIGRRFLRIISFNPIQFSHAAEFRNTKVSEHKSITSAKVEEDDMSRPTTNKAISRYTDRTHQRPMLSKVSYDSRNPLQVPECCFIQDFDVRISMVPAVHDEGLITIVSDFRRVWLRLLVVNCLESCQESITTIGAL